MVSLDSPNQNRVVKSAKFTNFDSPPSPYGESREIETLLNIFLTVTVELGTTTVKVSDILAWENGTIISLNKMPGEPADMLINRNKIAEGDVVVADDDKYGIRIVSISDTASRIKSI